MDEVCVGYLPAFIEYSNTVHGTSLEMADFCSYMFWEVPGCKLATREEAMRRVYAFHETHFFSRMRPIEGALEALWELRRHYELHIVTSRQLDIEAATRVCIETHFPGIFSGVHLGNHFGMCGKRVSKADMCRAIGAVAIIDDSLSHCTECAAEGVIAFVFGRYGWNEPTRSESDVWPPLVMRVPDWDAALRALLPTGGSPW